MNNRLVLPSKKFRHLFHHLAANLRGCVESTAGGNSGVEIVLNETRQGGSKPFWQFFR